MLPLEVAPDDGQESTPLAKRDASAEGEYSRETFVGAAKSRLGWLGLFLIGLWGAAFVVNKFEYMLEQDVELAYFVPLIIGHGGNAGGQAVSAVIKALATGDIRVTALRPMGRVVLKETLVGLVCGLALGAAVYALVVPGVISHDVGIVVAIALPLISVWANFIGGLLPLAASYLGSNPALTSAPLMTTIIDASGLVIYFLVAQAFDPAQSLDPETVARSGHHAMGHVGHGPHSGGGGGGGGRMHGGHGKHEGHPYNHSLGL